MATDFYRNLAWLPPAPADFRTRLSELAQAKDWGRAARTLAEYSLSDAQLGRLANALSARRASGASTAPLAPFRLGLVGNGTLELIGAALVGTFVRHGLALELTTGDYDQILPEALNPVSRVNAARPDAVLILVDIHGLPLRATPGDAAAAHVGAEAALGFIDQVRAGFAAHTGVPSILATIAPPPESLAGGIDRALPGTIRDLCARVNAGLAERAAASADLLLDVCALAETVGLAAWHDPTLWNIAKAQFALGYLPLLADHVARIAGAMRGKSRRALVLDLDNTLWGGVIGDDGLEGILIGQGDATGEAHLSVQHLALALRARGVVLAVSSKNTDEVARRPFIEHPDMALKLDDIAVFQANWNDKATNIQAIADTLSLGLESFVFLDDNPAERELVRRTLPEVAVPELPADPALYARTLAAAGYFELTAFSAEDRTRAEMYQGNADRAALKAGIADMDSYLASLNMEITFAPFDGVGRSRIAQLVNKSNQFNLTTRRYTETQVAQMETDPTLFTLQVRLADIFGDNGMICVIICRDHGGDWEIDTWLMSCRVLGRGVERMVLREVIVHAEAGGARRLVGQFIPTAKNGMVAGFYAGLGFSKVAEADVGKTRWALDLPFEVVAAPMRIVRSGFANSADA